MTSAPLPVGNQGTPGVRGRSLHLLAIALAALALAVLIVAWGPWHGPILLTILPGNGIDAGDLVVLPLVLLATWLLGRVPWRKSAASNGPAALRRVGLACITCGSLLLLLGLTRLLDLEGVGRSDAVLALLLAFAGLWLVIELVALVAEGGRDRVGQRAALVALAAGALVVDLLVVPTGTVFGVAAVCLGSAMALRRRSPRLAELLVALGVALAAASLASLIDLWGVDVRMAADEGGSARSASLGLVSLVLGIGLVAMTRRLTTDRSSTADRDLI